MVSEAIGEIEIEWLQETQCEGTRAGNNVAVDHQTVPGSALMFCQFYPALGNARINQGKKTPPSGRSSCLEGGLF